jgi:sugar phosphate isomerase/epimerase
MDFVLSGTELKDGEPVDELLRVARELEVRFVELWYPKNFAGDGPEGVARKLRAAGVRVASIASGTEMAREGDVSTDQRLLCEAIEVAARLEARFANTYFGYLAEQDDARAIRRYVEHVAPCLERARRLDITLTLENEFDAFGHDPAASDPTRRGHAAVALIEAVDSPHFKLTFDPCNAYFAGAEPFPAFHHRIRRHFAYLHVKDGHLLDGEPDPRWVTFTDSGRRYTTCDLGEGALNWPGLLAQLRADGYDGFVALEPHCAPGHREHAWRRAVAQLRRWTGSRS